MNENRDLKDRLPKRPVDVYPKQISFCTEIDICPALPKLTKRVLASRNYLFASKFDSEIFS